MSLTSVIHELQLRRRRGDTYTGRTRDLYAVAADLARYLMSPADAVLLYEAAELGMRAALRRDTERADGVRGCVWCGVPLEEALVLRGELGPYGLRYMAADCGCGMRTVVPYPLPYGVDPSIALGPGPLPVREPQAPRVLASAGPYEDDDEGDL